MTNREETIMTTWESSGDVCAQCEDNHHCYGCECCDAIDAQAAGVRIVATPSVIGNCTAEVAIITTWADPQRIESVDLDLAATARLRDQLSEVIAAHRSTDIDRQAMIALGVPDDDMPDEMQP